MKKLDVDKKNPRDTYVPFCDARNINFQYPTIS